MESSQDIAGNVEFVESMSTVEYDADEEFFQVTYDSNQDSTSLAIVATVATALGRDPQDLTPLQSAVDTEALDKLTAESSTGLGQGDSISFCYEGFEVTVLSEGVIEANPRENT